MQATSATMAVCEAGMARKKAKRQSIASTRLTNAELIAKLESDLK
jgi:hypothetical protein